MKNLWKFIHNNPVIFCLFALLSSVTLIASVVQIVALITVHHTVEF